MYEELVKKMRQQHQNMDCGNCNTCVIPQAANAIEELSKQVELEHLRGFADGYIAANRKNLKILKENETLKKELARYKEAEEKGYIITPPDSGLKVYLIDKTGEITKGNISNKDNIKAFLFDYAISINNDTM